MVERAWPDFTPVNLITGFLGSGKTTLLQKLLRSPALADTAVLINEFGDVGLDHHLLERIDETMVLLQSGCLCCTIRGELADSIRDLHAKRERGVVPPFRRLVIESTGLADPLPILTTITADPVLRHHFRLGLVITTVDAVVGWGQLDRQPESARQAAVADRLVLTKTDIADAAQIPDLVARLRTLNPTAPIIRPADGPFDVQALLGHDLFDIAAKSAEVKRWFETGIPDDSHHHAQDRNRHGDDVRAFSLVFDEPLDWTAFGLWLSLLLNRHGLQVLRVKGILNIAGEAAPVAVHGVQHLVHPPIHMADWPSADRRSRIVFICKGLDIAAIRRSFAAFVLKLPLESQINGARSHSRSTETDEPLGEFDRRDRTGVTAG